MLEASAKRLDGLRRDSALFVSMGVAEDAAERLEGAIAAYAAALEEFEASRVQRRMIMWKWRRALRRGAGWWRRSSGCWGGVFGGVGDAEGEVRRAA